MPSVLRLVWLSVLQVASPANFGPDRVAVRLRGISNAWCGKRVCDAFECGRGIRYAW